MAEQSSRKRVNKHTWTAEQEKQVRDTHAEHQCGVPTLSRLLPDIDVEVIRVICQHLGLRSANYHRWTDEEEALLIEKHEELGGGGATLTEFFPHIKRSSIDTKLTQLRKQQRIAASEFSPKTELSDEEHRLFREFIRKYRLSHRIPKMTKAWNEYARKHGLTEVTEDMVRYWARRKPAQNGRASQEQTDFTASDRADRKKRSEEHAEQFENEAVQEHEAAKARAAAALKRNGKQRKEYCRWCETTYPHTEDYFKSTKDGLEKGTCSWCRDRHRREYYRAQKAGPAALAAYKLRMKKEKRERMYDAQWEVLKAERMKLRSEMRKQKPKPKEKPCIRCKTSFPIAEPFYRAPHKNGNSFGSLCCFCQHHFDVGIRRAEADGKDQLAQALRTEREDLYLEENRMQRAARKQELRRKVKGTPGARSNCPNCGQAWPSDPKYAATFWRFSSKKGKKYRVRCLPCDWELEAQRRPEKKKRRAAKRRQDKSNK